MPLVFLTVLLFKALVFQSCRGLSVRFTSQQPLYVVSGNSLVLQAHIDLPQGDYITKVTWQHEAESQQNPKKNIIAEYPDKTGPSSRVKLENDGYTLKLTNYQRADGGVYTITVTDQKGVQGSTRRIVREYEAVHHVSVMVNVSHTVLYCREAWGTDPVFSWLHEKVAVTDAVGHTSGDGSVLHLSVPLCGHFTCVVSNQLGHSSATYTAEPCEKASNGTAVAVVCLMLLLLLAGGLAFMLWRRHGYDSNRRERLHESLEDGV